MIENMDIIYFTLFPWENPYSSVSLSFAKEFAKNNRVFYINTPYSIKDYMGARHTDLAKARKKNLFKNKMQYEQVPHLPENIIFAHPPMTFPINWLPNGMVYNAFKSYNDKVIFNTIKKVIDDYKLKNFIFINCFNPFHGAVIPKDFGAKLRIYQCIDDMMEEAYTKKHGVYLEEQAISDADVAFVTSKELYNLKSPFNKNTYIVHNAVDISIYQNVFDESLKRPAEIQRVTNKIIGFMGNMDASRIDYSLLRQVALSHSDKTLLLIGPSNPELIKENELDTLPNVIMTGKKDIRALPQYVKFMDVALIPFNCNKLTKSIYPLKINEYLAGGRAVVSTNFSEDIRGFSDHIYLANNHKEFIQQINKAIAENSDEKVNERRQVAKSNTWTSRVEQVWKIVEKHLYNEQIAINNEK